MLLFDFECKSCNIVEERLTKQGEQQYCKKCGAEMLKCMSAPGMVKTNFADKTGFKSKG